MTAIVNKSKCTGNAVCVSVCPVNAIKLVKGKAEVDANLCISCGACEAACPNNKNAKTNKDKAIYLE